MKKSLLSLSMVAASFFAVAQSYTPLKVSGTFDGFDILFPLGTGSGATKILDKPNNDVLTSAQTIPFSFNFYGKSVTQYKASDNGYITFDASATTSDNTPASLPSASEPMNAIFAFWGDWELKAAPNAQFPVCIYQYTYGSVGDRVHVIEWFGISPKGTTIAANSDVASFAIRLFEKGGFDVVYGNYGGSKFSGLIGVQDDAGTNAGVYNNSTSVSLPVASSNAGKDYLLMKFIDGAQKTLDLHVLFSQTAAIASINNTSGTPISVVVQNWGSTGITTAKMNYNIDGGADVSAPTGTVNFSANAGNTPSVTHATTYKPSSADGGKNQIVKVWFTEINGGSDVSDTLTFKLFINQGVSGTKHVLLEEGSGAWCGFCPDGHLKQRDILQNNTKGSVVGVIHHNGDKMTNAQSDIINSRFATGYPYGMVDRILFTGESTVGLSRNKWDAKVTERLATNTPVNVSIVNKSYNPTTRLLTFTVKADFVDYYSGDLRLNAFVIEDEVRGPDQHNQWTQHNYYSQQYSGSAGSPGDELYDMPEWMKGYKHNHVVRTIPSSAWGDATIIPSSVSPGSTYTKTFTWTVPATTKVTGLGSNSIPCTLCNEADGDGMNKPDFLKLVGFVSTYSTNNSGNEVLNVIEEESIFGTGITMSPSVGTAHLYPVPSNQVTYLSLNLSENTVLKFEVVNSLGQIVTSQVNQLNSGEQVLQFNTSEMPDGVYFININANGKTSTKRFVIAH